MYKIDEVNKEKDVKVDNIKSEETNKKIKNYTNEDDFFIGM